VEQQPAAPKTEPVSLRGVRPSDLALFSRKPVAYVFWKEVLKYSTDQQSFFEE
jgi:hypothetical protein